MQYVMYSIFVDDIMLSHNGTNIPDLKTVRMFHAVRQVAAPGAKSANSDGILMIVIIMATA